MNVIKPYFEILSPINREVILSSIELAGRNCYKSENKIKDGSAGEFVRMVIGRGHESVLEHEKVTVRFVCDRGVSHEIVRHRLASFSQESTRYCNYGKNGEITFIQPCWFDQASEESKKDWEESMAFAEQKYLKLLGEGWTPQWARSVLPNSLKTDIIVTSNMREWRTIFKLRCSNVAHPQMRELMIPLFEEFKRELPELFEDIKF
jgi:thymidylate synthase (FAD)